MRFRTEIEPVSTGIRIDATTPVLLLGSCFTDEVGSRLDTDGFRTVHNPLGPLYNPCSIHRCISLALDQYAEPMLAEGPRGFHALDFASRYSGDNATVLLAAIRADLDKIRNILAQSPVAILTLGSAYVFRHLATERIVGNCHKFPSDCFERRLLDIDEATREIKGSISALIGAGCRAVILTVSPIRHLADGLHGNTLSKATLHLAAEKVLAGIPDAQAGYFPSYEILMDDLRDYRFYAPDMKHPSETAVDYIYSIFSETYFSKATRAAALEARRRHLASLHRPIL